MEELKEMADYFEKREHMEHITPNIRKMIFLIFIYCVHHKVLQYSETLNHSNVSRIQKKFGKQLRKFFITATGKEPKDLF